MSILSLATSSSPWVFSLTTAAAGTKTYNLETAGTFLDRNIGISITTPPGSATISGNIEATASIGSTYDSTNEGYPITISGSKSLTPIITTGWISLGTAGTITTSGTSYVVLSSLSATEVIPKVSDGLTITIGAGYYPSARTVSVKGMSSGTAAAITPSFGNSGLSTYFDTSTSSNYNMYIQPKYLATVAGYKALDSSAVATNGTISYYTIKTTSLSAGSGSTNMSVSAGDSTSLTNLSLSLLNDTPSTGVYYTINSTGSGTVSSGTGWVTSGSKSSNTANTSKYIVKSVTGSAVSGSLPTGLSRTSGTYIDSEILPYGYIKIPAGYNPLDRYIWANKANLESEATAASGYGLTITSLSGSDAVAVGSLNSGYYPIIANNISATGTFTASTPGWFSSASATDNDTDSLTVGKMAAATCTIAGGGLTKGEATGGGLSLGTATGGTLSKGTASGGTLSGGGLTAGAGAVSIEKYSEDSSSYGGVNIASSVGTIVSDTGTTIEPTSGYYVAVKISGSGTVNRAKIERAAFSLNVTKSAFSLTVNRAAFTLTVSRAAITDVHTAGYLPAKSATTAISVSSETVSLAEGSQTVSTAAETQTVTLAAGSIDATSLSSNTLTKYAYIPITAGDGSISGNNLSGTNDVSVYTTDSSSYGGINISGIIGTKATTEPSSGYFLAFTGSSSASALTLTFTTNTAGYIPTSFSKTRSVSYSATNATKYFPIAAATFSTSGNTVKSSAAGYVPSGTTVGTVSAGTIKSGSATITSVSYGYDNTNTRFNITGSATVSAPSVDTAGYVSSSVGTKNTNTASVSTTVARVGTGVTITNGGASSVSINRTTTSASGATNVGTGSSTTTAPTSGYFVSVLSSANTKTLTATPKVTSAGYGTTDYYGATAGTSTVGASASSVTYITVPGGIISSGSTNLSSYVLNATVVPAEGYLYIGAGYYPNTLISLASMIPDDANYTNAGTGQMLSGYEAYDTNGKKLIGTIATLSPSSSYYTTTNTSFGALGAGYLNLTYYIKAVSAIPKLSASSASATATAAISNVNSMTNVSTSLPSSGTAGTDYWRVQATATVSGSAAATPQYVVTSAGWVDGTKTGLSTAIEMTKNNDSTGKSIYIGKATCTVAGGGLSITNNYSGTPTVSLATGSDTNMANTSIGSKDTTNYPYYFKINASSSSLSGTTEVTRADIEDTHTAGYLPAKTATTVISSTTSSPTVTVNAGSGSTYINLKKAAMSIGGTNTVTATASLSGNNITLGSIDNGISITATGGASGSITATATTSTAGYAPASTLLGSKTITGSASKTASNYISAVKLVPPSSGTRSFTIEVPNGSTSSYIKFCFTVDTSGNVVVTEGS